MKTLNLWAFSTTALFATLGSSSADPDSPPYKGYPEKQTYSYSYPSGAYPAYTQAPEPTESVKPFEKPYPGFPTAFPTAFPSGFPTAFPPGVPTGFPEKPFTILPSDPDYKDIKIVVDFPDKVIRSDGPGKAIKTYLPPGPKDDLDFTKALPFFDLDDYPIPGVDFFPDVSAESREKKLEDDDKKFEEIFKNIRANFPEGVFPGFELPTTDAIATPGLPAKTTLVTVTGAPPAKPSPSYVYKYDQAP